MLNKNLILRRICPIGHKDEIRQIWEQVQKNASHSFFGSWGWIGVWLDSLQDTDNVSVLVGECSGSPVLCCVLVEKISRSLGFLKKNVAYINATGDPTKDDLTIEYNGMLVDHRYSDVRAVFSDDSFAAVDEFSIPGMGNVRQLSQYFDHSFFSRIDVEEPCHFVDLEEIRQEGKNYLDSLSTNSRGQIRRSLRRLNLLGDVHARAAGSVSEALLFLDRLVELHQREWNCRGEAGAFSSGYFLDFHKDLIRKRYGEGEIQLLEVSAGQNTVGYLYSFIYNSEVLFYQSGFNYEELKRERPGVVSHYLAIELALELGCRRYNFLAGDARYKRSLANRTENLHWVAGSRKSMTSRVEFFLRCTKRVLLSFRSTDRRQ